jgi:hypothetical protein
MQHTDLHASHANAALSTRRGLFGPEMYTTVTSERSECEINLFPKWEVVRVPRNGRNRILLIGNPSTCPCFSSAVTTACRLLAPTPADDEAAAQTYAAAHDDCFGARNASGVAERVLMSQLAVGDRVLAQDGTTRALYEDAVVDVRPGREERELLTLHYSQGALTLTPTHEVWADGALIEAREVEAGASLAHSSGKVTVERVSTSKGAVINPVVCGDRILAADGDGQPVLATTMTKRVGYYAESCKK